MNKMPTWDRFTAAISSTNTVPQAIQRPLEAAKVELYHAFRASGIRKSELARRLGIPKTNVDRLFLLNRKSRFDQIEAPFQALGKRLEIEVRDAA